MLFLFWTSCLLVSFLSFEILHKKNHSSCHPRFSRPPLAEQNYALLVFCLCENLLFIPIRTFYLLFFHIRTFLLFFWQLPFDRSHWWGILLNVCRSPPQQPLPRPPHSLTLLLVVASREHASLWILWHPYPLLSLFLLFPSHIYPGDCYFYSL